MNTYELDKTYVANTYARFNLNITGGKGSVVTDENGKEYIDLGTGIAVNTFGFCDEEWIKAVTDQLCKFQHTSNLYYSEPCAKLAQMLCEKTGMKKVFFSNSGAESNECAIKAARRYGQLKNGESCYKIITLKNSFHGRTLTTLAATGQDAFHKDFTPLTDGFIYAEANNCEEIEALSNDKDVAAIMIEIVQGEGGVNALNPEFIEKIAEIAKKRDILVITDEVQCGNGRSGKLYGYMNYNITPDIVTTAKGIGGGLPIGVTMLGEKVQDIFTPGLNGSTFGGNPVCCAGAISILSRLDEAMLAGVREKSEYIKKTLSGKPGIKSVSGLGLMLGIETEKDAGEVIKYCQENGVLVIKAKNKVRLLPALNIPQELLEKAINVICEACR